jgi:phosphomannomutase
MKHTRPAWAERKSGLREQGYDVIFSFEEAIGFCVGDLVKDKDGVCAAAVFAEMASTIEREEGLTVSQQLARLSERYGYFLNKNHYVKCYDPEIVAAIFTRLRNGGDYQAACGRYKIANVRDLTTGYDSSTADGSTVLPASPSSEMITFTFENGSVVTLRTSGTEPKLKYYVELRTEEPETAQSDLDELVRCVIEEFLQAEENNLEFPED